MMIRNQLTIVFVLLGMHIYAQEGTNTAGGDATGLGGSVSFTVGQLDYLVSEDSIAGGDSLRMAGPVPGNTSQGIQHAVPHLQTTLTSAESAVEISSAPNPAVDFIDVVITNFSGEAISYSLTDAAGKIVINSSSSAMQFRIDVTDVASGNYVLRFFSGTTEIRNQNLVISK